MPDPTNPPSVPSLDVEAQPDPSKLESRVDLHRTATQPEKEGLAAGSGTPLDVEACSLCGRPLTWNESDRLKAWVCHNCPGTPSEAVDVEACVRLMEQDARVRELRAVDQSNYAFAYDGNDDRAAAHQRQLAAQNDAEAATLRSLITFLRSALPGMGKDSERLAIVEGYADALEDFAEHAPDCPLHWEMQERGRQGPCECGLSGLLQSRRARAAQPEETKP